MAAKRILAEIAAQCERALKAVRRRFPARRTPSGQAPDFASRLIRAADGLEMALRTLPRVLRRAARYSLARMTAGLLWRSAAAVTGIGMATALVTGLSAEGSAPRLAGTLEPDPVATVRDVRVQPRLAGAPTIEWIVVDGVPQLALQAPELAGIAQRRTLREAENGRSREETLVLGGMSEDRGHLHLRVRTGPAAQNASGPFTVHFIRQASEQGLSVDRTGLPAAVATAWGALDKAEIVLSDGKAQRTCIAFRSPGGQEPALSGWWCARGGGVLDVAELRCLVDRLEIDGFTRAAPPGCATERSASAHKSVRSAVNERDRRERTR